jgi:hypothetical protein
VREALVSEHKVRAIIRVVVCECGWQARSDRVRSLDDAFRDHQHQQMLVGLRRHLALAQPDSTGARE